MAREHEVKAQPIRLLDVFFVGPVMVLAGRRLSRSGDAMGDLLTALGVLTVWYNGRNYLRIEKER